MFVGPDQLLLGVLGAAVGGGGSGGGAGTASALLEAALGGGDVDSVREWLNEQAGVVAPLVYGGGGSSVSSSTLRPSDVEFTGPARGALRLAREGAEAMGSRSVGTYHILLVLLQGGVAARPRSRAQDVPPGGPPGAAPAAPEGSTEPPESGAPPQPAAAAGAGRSSGGTTPGVGGGVSGRTSGLLPALLRAVGADTVTLQLELLALAEVDAEAPPPVVAAEAYQDVVMNLRSTYQQLSSRPLQERDDAAFRAAQPRPRGGSAAQADDDDVYE